MRALITWEAKVTMWAAAGAAGVAVWLIVLLVDRLDTGSRHVLDGGLAIVGCFAAIFIVAALYIRATLR
jgi:hypothetical protein